MKKIISITLILALAISMFTLGASAITDTEWADLKFTLVQQSMNGVSLSADVNLPEAKYQMRAMASTPDGQYMFGGYLNPKGSSAVEMFKVSDGTHAGTFKYLEADGAVSYPKGLATDDRGYLYVALASNSNKANADFAVVKYDEVDSSTGYLKQVSYTNICKTSADTKTGVNGITVQEVGGNYYTYIVVNYDVDYLYRFDVTIPETPVLDTTFGNNGFINLQDETYGGSDACYLDVDEDGIIYLGITKKSDQGLMILSADGKTVLNYTVQTKAYGVALYGDYILVTSQNSGNICVYNKYTYALVSTISVTPDNIVLPFDEDRGIIFNSAPNSLCNLSISGDILFLGDQGSGNSGFDQIFAVGLTPEAAATVEASAKAIGARLDAAYPAETTPADTTAPTTPEDTTAPTTPDNTTAPEADNTTEAPDSTTAAPNDTEPTPDTGCASALSGAVAVIALFGTALVIGKRR